MKGSFGRATKTHKSYSPEVDGDHLGSTTSVVQRDTGERISYQLYEPWGTTRYSSGDQRTDYAYTGQMKVDDIYYYNARWYDPEIGRFMQADTLIPGHQGTQAFDRYAYVNNNPLNYTDPSGFYACSDMYDPGCFENDDEIKLFNRMRDSKSVPNMIPPRKKLIIFAYGRGDGVSVNDTLFLPYKNMTGFNHLEIDPDNFPSDLQKYNTAQELNNILNTEEYSNVTDIYCLGYSAGAGICGVLFDYLTESNKSKVRLIAIFEGVPDASFPGGGEYSRFISTPYANNNGNKQIDLSVFLGDQAKLYGFEFHVFPEYSNHGERTNNLEDRNILLPVLNR